MTPVKSTYLWLDSVSFVFFSCYIYRTVIIVPTISIWYLKSKQHEKSTFKCEVISVFKFFMLPVIMLIILFFQFIISESYFYSLTIVTSVKDSGTDKSNKMSQNNHPLSTLHISFTMFYMHFPFTSLYRSSRCAFVSCRHWAKLKMYREIFIRVCDRYYFICLTKCVFFMFTLSRKDL